MLDKRQTNNLSAMKLNRGGLLFCSPVHISQSVFYPPQSSKHIINLYAQFVPSNDSMTIRA